MVVSGRSGDRGPAGQPYMLMTHGVWRHPAWLIVGAATLAEDMTMAMRVAIESEGKIVLYGDSFQVTTSGAKSLLS